MNGKGGKVTHLNSYFNLQKDGANENLVSFTVSKYFYFRNVWEKNVNVQGIKEHGLLFDFKVCCKT